LVERELLLFALFWFIIGMVDEMAMDAIWLGLRLTGRARTPRLPTHTGTPPLAGLAAVLIPAWREDEVIGATVAHMLGAWPQRDYRIYIGCYRNDAATVSAAIGAAGRDARVRLVIHDRLGPTTKADCLNRLYLALAADEARTGRRFATVLLQDAEDMVHPLGLTIVDQGLSAGGGGADFVQLPVHPELDSSGCWVSGHYADEFAESHGKALVVRDWLQAALPAAGVGCGFSRVMLERIGAVRRGMGESGPFAADCLTEDYELGLLIERFGGRSRFLRLRDAEGQLIATRSYFPCDLASAVRQKTRWVHGIALQSWDRLGWVGRPVGVWMALRDRRGPLTALMLAQLAGAHPRQLASPALVLLMRVSLAGLVWRAAMRFAFTAREYGPAEGVRALLRIPVANVITIMAGRRALLAYIRSLRGERVVWDKTAHHLHPALGARAELIA
jgi:adsorption protein B